MPDIPSPDPRPVSNRRAVPTDKTRMARVSTTVSTAACVVTLLVCSDSPTQKIPAWVENPYIEGGLATSQCVKNYPGQRNILMSKARSLGRANIAADLAIYYSEGPRRNHGFGGAVRHRNLDPEFGHLIDEKLARVRMAKSGYFEMKPGVEYLCVMMVLDPARWRES
jgi:hypothetical protein